MLSITLQFLFFAVFIECLTELLVKDDILQSFRENLVMWSPDSLAGFLASILSCGRCMSGWVSLIPVPIVLSNTGWSLLSLPFVWFVLWRLSNMVHGFVDTLHQKRNDNGMD